MGQIDIEGNRLRVVDMPVLKRHMSYVPIRTVPVRMDEPLTREWIDLMPAEGKFFSFKYNTLYNMIADLQRPEGATHGPWWPHRFRSERARELVREYKFDALLLKQFFEMARITTPMDYANPDLAAVELKLGI
jgi:hypothetical protein